MRAELGREITVRVRVDSEDGTLIASDALPVLTVKDSIGATVTAGAASSESTGVYKAVIPARSVLDVLTVSWAFAVSSQARTVTEEIKLISERLVPYYRLREDAELTTASLRMLQLVSDKVEEWFEDALNFPPVAISERVKWWQPFETSKLHVPGAPFPISVVSLSNGTGAATYVYGAPELADLDCIGDSIERSNGAQNFLSGGRYGVQFPVGAYVAVITHGGPWSRPPEDLRSAAATFARYCARPHNYPERARRVVSELAEIDFSMPAADKPTGLPDVDAVLNRYGIPAIG